MARASKPQREERRILEWRESGKADHWGEPGSEAYVEGVGWCAYSWRLCAILIGREWRTYEKAGVILA